MDNVMLLVHAVAQFFGMPIFSGVEGQYATITYWVVLIIMLNIAASVVRTIIDS